MTTCQEEAPAENRGEGLLMDFRVNFAVLGGFFGPFFLVNKEQKIHPKVHSKIEISVGDSRGQDTHCKDQALTTSARSCNGRDMQRQ